MCFSSMLPLRTEEINYLLNILMFSEMLPILLGIGESM